MVDTVILYKSESFHGDVLTFEVGVSDVGKVGCDFFFRVKNKHTGKEVAQAKTGVVFFDYDARKVMNVPEEFKRLFAEHHEI